MKERDVVIDIDSPVEEGENRDHSDELINGENLVNLSNAKIVNGLSPNSVKKEKRKSMSAKKPPRPPRGLSLDPADQKLIKEISELAMIKRVRIERMKALKKTRAIKALSISSSSSGNFIAMLFTILFCIVIIFQGCHSSGISPRHSSAIVNPGSPNSNEASSRNIISVQDRWYLTSNSLQANAGTPNPMELVSGSDNKYNGRKMMDK